MDGALVIIIAFGICFMLPGLIAMAVGLIKCAASKDNLTW